MWGGGGEIGKITLNEAPIKNRFESISQGSFNGYRQKITYDRRAKQIGLIKQCSQCEKG